MSSSRIKSEPSKIYVALLTYVSWVPKKKIGYLLAGGFTAPSGSSSILGLPITMRCDPPRASHLTEVTEGFLICRAGQSGFEHGSPLTPESVSGYAFPCVHRPGLEFCERDDFWQVTRFQSFKKSAAAAPEYNGLWSSARFLVSVPLPDFPTVSPSICLPHLPCRSVCVF